jgi:transposase InsO family protein
MLGLSVKTFDRWIDDPNGDKRRGPVTVPSNKLSTEERQEILATLNSAEYRDKSCSQIVPYLADKGIYLASESTFYRIQKSEGLNVHRGKSRPSTRSRPLELIASMPNQLWSWDITFLRSQVSGVFYYLYLVMDIYSRKIVGFEVKETQSSDIAADMIERICRNEKVARNQVTLHSDNGKPMKGATMLARLQMLGVMPSFSRPSVSDDNPFSESLFKTTKYCPMYPSKPFESELAAIAWVEKFIHWYNDEHLHSGIRFITPSARHSGKDVEQLLNRKIVYENAKSMNPKRWSSSTRNWNYIGEVPLNCLQRKTRQSTKRAA